MAAFTNATARRYGWVAVLSCFAAGAAIPLAYTLVLLQEGRLFLRDTADIERNRDRIGTARAVGWILAAGLLAAGVGLGGLSRAAFLATLAGVTFGFWPGLFANFVRLRREHHWRGR